MRICFGKCRTLSIGLFPGHISEGKMMKKVILIFALTLGVTMTAVAGPLAPTLSATSPTAGETTMLSTYDGVTPVGYVEWLVLTPGDYGSQVFAPLVKDVFGASAIPGGQYLYAYEVKSLIDNGNALTINADPASRILNTGSSNLNLEEVGHDPVTFSNLGAPGPDKHHVANESKLVSQAGIDTQGNTVTWSFAGQLNDNEVSETLWFVSTSVPNYRPAVYAGEFSSDTGGGNTAGGGGAHTPAPGAMLLGMIGLSVIGWVKRRLA
jgi:hypothetical protein